VVEWPTLVFGAWLLLLAGWLLLVRSLDFGRPQPRFPRRPRRHQWRIDPAGTRLAAMLLASLGAGLVVVAFVRG
jgi:hypothetical protein